MNVDVTTKENGHKYREHTTLKDGKLNRKFTGEVIRIEEEGFWGRVLYDKEKGINEINYAD